MLIPPTEHTPSEEENTATFETDWTQAEKAELNQHLKQSMAEAARGELYTPEQVRRILAEDRLRHPG